MSPTLLPLGLGLVALLLPSSVFAQLPAIDTNAAVPPPKNGTVPDIDIPPQGPVVGYNLDLIVEYSNGTAVNYSEPSQRFEMVESVLLETDPESPLNPLNHPKRVKRQADPDENENENENMGLPQGTVQVAKIDGTPFQIWYEIGETVGNEYLVGALEIMHKGINDLMLFNRAVQSQLIPPTDKLVFHIADPHRTQAFQIEMEYHKTFGYPQTWGLLMDAFTLLHAVAVGKSLSSLSQDFTVWVQDPRINEKEMIWSGEMKLVQGPSAPAAAVPNPAAAALTAAAAAAAAAAAPDADPPPAADPPPPDSPDSPGSPGSPGSVNSHPGDPPRRRKV